jgi:hypothetical protein
VLMKIRFEKCDAIHRAFLFAEAIIASGDAFRRPVWIVKSSLHPSWR